MTDDVNKLAALRLGKMENNVGAKPIDLLRTAIHDIETGELKCDGLLIVWMERPAGADWDHGTYRANVSRDQELVFLELAKERCLRSWLRK